MSSSATRGYLIRSGPFARLWWANFVSSLGDWVTLFATFSLGAKMAGGGSSASLGILVVLVARILPGLLSGVVGGVLADRLDRKLTMVVSDFGRAGLVFVLIFVTNLTQLFAVTFFIEVLSQARQPAREAVVPTLIPARSLMAANGLNLVAAYGTAPLGSALFALISEISTALGDFGAFGPAVASAFAFDVVTFVVSGLIVLTIPIPPMSISAEREGKGKLDLQAAWQDLAEGVRLVTRPGTVRRMVVGMTVGLFGGGVLFVLGQPFAEEVLRASDSGYGTLITALGLGVVIGMGGVTVLGKNIKRREPWFAWALLVIGLGIVLTAISTSIPSAVGWTFLTGVGTGTAYVVGFTHLHSAVTDEVRGRTFAALFASARAALLVSFGMAGIGAAALHEVLPGPLQSGIRAVMVLGALVITATGIVLLWTVRKQVRPGKLDQETITHISNATHAISWVRGHLPRRNNRH